VARGTAIGTECPLGLKLILLSGVISVTSFWAIPYIPLRSSGPLWLTRTCSLRSTVRAPARSEEPATG